MTLKDAKLDYLWNLRQLMAARNMFSTTDLAPLLEERGIHLSAAQVYRLVTQVPERLSLRTLVALCDILECSPSDLIEPAAGAKPETVKAVASGGGKAKAVTPTRARVAKR